MCLKVFVQIICAVPFHRDVSIVFQKVTSNICKVHFVAKIEVASISLRPTGRSSNNVIKNLACNQNGRVLGYSLFWYSCLTATNWMNILKMSVTKSNQNFIKKLPKLCSLFYARLAEVDHKKISKLRLNNGSKLRREQQFFVKILQ